MDFSELASQLCHKSKSVTKLKVWFKNRTCDSYYLQGGQTGEGTYERVEEFLVPSLNTFELSGFFTVHL